MKGISDDTILDTGPDAYYAFWSPGSKVVAMTFRRKRHVVEVDLFRIDGRRRPRPRRAL